MKKITVALMGTLLGLATLAAVSASPEQLSPPHRPHHVSSQKSGPFDMTQQLSIGDIRLGMSRDQVRALHLTAESRPLDLKYDRSSNVSFVTGPYLSQGGKPFANGYEPLTVLHTWGKPALHGTCGTYVINVYKAGLSLVILRYEPASLDRRAGTIGEFGITSDVAWVPYEWGHTLIQNSGL
jgi:hypothetical protein